MNLRDLSVGSLVIALGVSFGAPASAAEDPKPMPQSVAVDLKRLGTELDLYTAQTRRMRTATALSGLGIGSVLVPSGVVLFGRTDGISRALVIGMIIGGSAQIASVPFVFIPTPMDGIRDEFLSRPPNGDDEATVRILENAWRVAADNSRRRRMVVGTTMLSVGVTSLASGLTFLLASEGIFGMSRQTQYTVGGVLMGVGVQVTTLGVRFLFEWSPEETSWESYRAMKSDATYLSRLSAAPSPSMGVVPVPGGGVAFATISF